MRHRKNKYHLNRFTSWRKATIQSIAKNVLLHQSIKTTSVKAKASKPLIDKLITLAKKNDLHSRRMAYAIICDHALVKRLFTEIGPLFKNRAGGYTRIINLGNRRGDNARLVILELTEIKKKAVTKPPKKKGLKKEENPEGPEETKPQEKKKETSVALQEKPPKTTKPTKKFLGNLRSIFKKERDSL